MMADMDARWEPGIGDERDPPPHFAGRKEELGWLQERLDRICRDGAASGGLNLIVGVPGAGKTHLAMEFAKRIEAARRADGVKVAAKLTDTSMLGMDDALLFVEIAKALGEEKGARRIADLDARTTGRQLSLQEPSAGEREGAPLACNGLKYGATKDVARSTERLASLLEMSRERGVWKRRALALMFDELQTVTKRQAESLAVLHQGLHGCPIMLLGVGLRHSPAVLAEFGISRTKRPRHLGCLSREEAIEAIQRGFEKAVGEMPRTVAERLAAASHGFPQHINGYLQGAQAVYRKHGSLHTEAALAEALAMGDDTRIGYYNARLTASKARDEMIALAGAMASENIADMRRRDAQRTVSTADAEFNGRDAIERAIRHGGIPSFHNHMVEQWRDAVRERRAPTGTSRA